MVIELLAEKRPGQRTLADYLRPRADRNGVEREERVVFCGVSWKDYLALDGALVQDRQHPRLYFYDEQLEIMSTSERHDELKTWIGDFVADFVFERDIDAFPRGQATMRLSKTAVAEPDESWCLHKPGRFPDLVLEVALTSGGLPKLEIYRRFGVREVWFWRKEKVETWALRADRSGYDLVKASVVLPGFDFGLLARCLAMMPRWNEARRAFRDALRAQ